MAREPEGVLLVDKPAGPTSHDVVRDVRRLLKTRAVGHTGTLDPFATGLLVVVVGRYTRLSPYLTDEDKAYEATISFGRSTTTDDGEGETVETGDPAVITRAALVDAIAALSRISTQRAPAYSAIKRDGVPLYERARRGEEVVAPEREVAVREASLESFVDGRAVVRFHVSKGTYIRALARDLGAALGCPAHCSALRRTASGRYLVDDAAPLASLDADVARARLMAGPRAVPSLHPLTVDDAQARAISVGRRFAAPTELSDGALALAWREGEPLAVIARDGAECRVVRGFGG